MEHSSATAGLLGAPVGRLDADRLCPRCLHQLSGQPIYLLPGLDIRHVRCPECGAHAPVTEHPTTNRWLRRLGGFIAAFLVLALLALLAIDVGAGSAGLYTASSDTTQVYAELLEAEGANDANQASRWYVPDSIKNNTARLNALAADPALQQRAWERFWMFAIPAMIIGTVSGIVWSVILAHRRWYIACFWLLVPQTISMVFVSVIYMMSSGQGASVSYYDFAFFTFGAPFLLAAAGVLFATRLIAFLLARPVVLVVIRLLLPQRLARSIHSVWIGEDDDARPARSPA